MFIDRILDASGGIERERILRFVAEGECFMKWKHQERTCSECGDKIIHCFAWMSLGCALRAQEEMPGEHKDVHKCRRQDGHLGAGAIAM